MEVQTHTAAKETSVAVSQEDGRLSILRLSHATLRHILLKGFVNLPQRHLFNHVHCCSIHNSQKWKQPSCPSAEEWVKKVWHIYTMEDYSAIKKEEIMKFSGKWVELEKKSIN